MASREVPYTEAPQDAFTYTTLRFRDFLRETLSTTAYYDRTFDWDRNPKQRMVKDLLKHPPSNRTQYVLLKGSVGSGKSICAHAYALEQLATYPGATWFGMRNTHDEILLTLWAQIRKFLMEFRVPFTDGKDPAYLELPNGSAWRFWSARAVVASTTADAAKGLGSGEFSGATLEEADAIQKEAVDTIPMRMREPSGIPTRVIFYIANPPSDTHWLYKMFEEKNIKHPDYHPEDYHSIKFTMEDNRLNLPEGYIESQYAMYANKPSLLRKFVHGEWGPEIRGHPIFGDIFDRRFHVSKTSFLSRWMEDKLWRDGPVCMGWDFGAEHPAMVAFQDADYGRFRQIRILGAWLGDNELLRFFGRYVIDKLYELTPHAEYLTYADPAGKSRDNRGVTEENAFDILRDLGLHPRGRKSSIDYGIDLIANLLTSTAVVGGIGVQPKLLVDNNPYTQDIIDGFEIGLCQNPNRTGRADKWDPVRDDKYIHLFDGLRYAIVHRRKPREVSEATRPTRPDYAPIVRHTDSGMYVAAPNSILEELQEEISGPQNPVYRFGG